MVPADDALTSGSGTFGCDLYKKDADYTWLITRPSNIELEIHSLQSVISLDYLYIYDGDKNTDALLYSNSGQPMTSPDLIVSSGNKMLILKHHLQEPILMVSEQLIHHVQQILVQTENAVMVVMDSQNVVFVQV